MMYPLTPEEHAQIVDALNIGIAKHYDLAEDVRIGNALAMLKAMKPVEPSSNAWIPCTQKTLPVGVWLVTLLDGEMHVADKHPNLTNVGGLFYFDREPITHYTALPAAPLYAKEQQ